MKPEINGLKMQSFFDNENINTFMQKFKIEEKYHVMLVDCAKKWRRRKNYVKWQWTFTA